ncbi:hypothetical protein LRH25_27340 [Ideonella azotifigens]|uniref:hypothetical protein n=1 Tax=Ideonella azotifigens TaxID=513160 RepID=UPI001E50DD9C|nr:hypothetical protein [Ideonella azotifigens]MCD2344043.1 hypothetical protein [Ideonella azotifigens]
MPERFCQLKGPLLHHARLLLPVGVLACAFALGGCELLQPKPPTPAPAASAPPEPPSAPASVPPPPPPPASAPHDPIDDAGRQLQAWQEELRQSTPEQVALQASRLAAEPALPPTALHLALLWLNTRAAGDSARAWGVLDTLQKQADPAAQPWAFWARLLLPRAAEQKRLEEQLDRQAAQMRDTQRRIDQLNGQLEALKAIERSLAPRRPGDGR